MKESWKGFDMNTNKNKHNEERTKMLLSLIDAFQHSIKDLFIFSSYLDVDLL